MKIKIIIFLFIFFCPVLVLAGQIDINSATLSQLDELTGIGPKYAQAIIDGRPFSSVDDLEKVKGIGPKTLQKIKDQGFACVNCLTAQSAQTIVQPTQPTAAPTPPTTPTATPAVIYPGGVFINEILPNPQGADETEEWVELYNSNTLDADLSGWQLQDIAGTITTFSIPTGTKISANEFLVFKRPDTKIMLNNDEDGLSLLTPDKKITDSMTFSKAPLGQSYNKTASGWAWSTVLTPGDKNVILAVAKASNTPTAQKAKQTVLPKTKNSVTNDGVELGLAGLSQNNNESNPWLLFFTVLATTIILASIVLLIKYKFSKNHVRT